MHLIVDANAFDQEGLPRGRYRPKCVESRQEIDPWVCVRLAIRAEVRAKRQYSNVGEQDTLPRLGVDTVELPPGFITAVAAVRQLVVQTDGAEEEGADAVAVQANGMVQPWSRQIVEVLVDAETCDEGRSVKGGYDRVDQMGGVED